MLIPNISAATPVAPLSGAPGAASPPPNSSVGTAKAVPAAIPTSGQLQTAVDGANHTLQQSKLNLAFSVDTATKTPVVTLTDSMTGQVVLQFPSREALAVAQSIEQAQQRQGLLLNHKA